jgi:RimJ/RimL family protein N-acetyltransferase
MLGFTTKRLTATPVAPSDCPFLTRLWQNDRVMHWIGGVLTDEQVDTTLEHDVHHWEEYGFGRWVLRANGAEIGHVKLAHWQGPRGEEVEIGYALLPSVWGQGLATEAVQGAIGFAVEHRVAESLVAFATVGNDSSFRVMQRLGFEFEADIPDPDGTVRVYRRSLVGPE